MPCKHILVGSLSPECVVAQDAEFMEQKKNDRASRGSNAWQPQARQQELDEADRFQVVYFSPSCILVLALTLFS